MIHAAMWCPSCGGKVVPLEGSVVFDRALRPVVDTFLACTACPLVSQVASETGQLIDLEGHWEVADLQFRPEIEIAYPTPPQAGRLMGRRDS